MTIPPISLKTKSVLNALVFLLGAALIAVFTWQHVSALPQTGEVKRELSVLETNWPSKLLTIEEITGVNAKDFPDGFSIKVKNISDRPIYYMKIHVHLPNSGPYLNGRPGSIALYWGDPKLASPNELASTNHESIAPGESLVLALSQDRINHFFDQATNRSEFLSQGISKLVVNFQRLSFGDGIYFVHEPFVPNTKGTKDTSGLIRNN